MELAFVLIILLYAFALMCYGIQVWFCNHARFIY